MDELQGLHLINVMGTCHGTIERNFYNPGRDKYIIHYKALDGSYKVHGLEPEEFERYSSYAKLKSDRYDIINNRDIRHMYHFSPINNITSILNTGLYSREKCERENINIEITDQNRFDGELNRISTSISFPNYRMRYSLEKQNFNLVIYDINPKILLSKLDTQFYYTNAANAIFRYTDKRLLTTNEALEGLFTPVNREPGLYRNYTTDPQAEILVNEEVPNCFINGIITKNYNANIEEICNQKRLRYEVNSSLYSYRSDYARWR